MHETAHSKLHDPKRAEPEPTWKVVMVSDGGTKRDFSRALPPKQRLNSSLPMQTGALWTRISLSGVLEVEEDHSAEVQAAKGPASEEVQAESISYAVCQYYGIQTGENSFGYIAS